MTRIIIAAIVALLVIGAIFTISDLQHQKGGITNTKRENAPESEKHFHSFKDSKNRFEAKFPSLPTHMNEALNDPRGGPPKKYEMFVSNELDLTTYMVTIATFPKESTDEEIQQAFEDALNKIRRSSSITQTKEIKKITFLGIPATQIYTINGDYSMKGVCFIKDRAIYLISYIALRDNFNDADFEMFKNSFKFINPSS